MACSGFKQLAEAEADALLFEATARFDGLFAGGTDCHVDSG